MNPATWARHTARLTCAARAGGAIPFPGEGEVDWNFVIRRLEDVGYDGVLSVELEDHYFWQTPELQQEGLLRAKDHIEPLLRG